MYVRVLEYFSHVCLFVALWTTASQAPLSIGFSIKILEWVACPPPGILLIQDKTWVSYVSLH